MVDIPCQCALFPVTKCKSGGLRVRNLMGICYEDARGDVAENIGEARKRRLLDLTRRMIWWRDRTCSSI